MSHKTFTDHLQLLLSTTHCRIFITFLSFNVLPCVRSVLVSSFFSFLSVLMQYCNIVQCCSEFIDRHYVLNQLQLYLSITSLSSPISILFRKSSFIIITTILVERELYLFLDWLGWPVLTYVKHLMLGLRNCMRVMTCSVQCKEGQPRMTNQNILYTDVLVLGGPMLLIC